MAKTAVVDLTNVKESRGFSKKRMPAGDYRARIIKVDDEKAKSDKKDQWLFTIQLVETPSAKYPYYVKYSEDNQLWKVRNLLVAAGFKAPKKKINVNPDKLVGREIAVSLEDDEYDGKDQSVIEAVFPISELEGRGGKDVDEDDDDDEVPVKSAKKAKKAPEPDDDDDDDEDEDEDEDDEPPAKAKKKAKKKAPEPEPEDDDEDDDSEDEDEDEDEPEPPKKSKKKDKAKKKKAKSDDVDDDDLDELDIDDL